MRLLRILGLSVAVGFGSGILLKQVNPTRGDIATAPDRVWVGEPTAALPSESSPSGEGMLQGASDGENFEALSQTRQKEVLLRLSTRILRGGGTGDMLLMAKLVGELGFEQGAVLLEQFSEAPVKPDPADGARDALVERLAALNPSRVLEMGKSSENPKLAQAAIAAIAQKSGADAIRALAQLPDKFRTSVAAEMRGSFNDSLCRAGGSIADVGAVLKENPKLLDPKSASEGAVRRIVGQIASQAAAVDAASAMAEVRRLATDLVQVKPGEDPKAAESALVARIGSQMTKAMRADAPGSERSVFNLLLDTEKNEVQVALEAAARFRREGAESAIQFAEKQGKEQFTKNAASGVWWALAQQNRSSAMQWIETLPPGPFRDGAWSSLMQEASFRARSWGDSTEAVHAGEELLSKASRLDYYAFLAGQNRTPGLSRSEFIESLPLPEGDKLELRRRLAPIRSK
jgi:hypothetical protein